MKVKQYFFGRNAFKGVERRESWKGKESRDSMDEGWEKITTLLPGATLVVPELFLS